MTDQIIVTIRLDTSRRFEEAQPVFWDQYSNGGYGSWNPDFCKTVSKNREMIRFSCSRLGYYGVRYLRSENDPLLLAKNAAKWHHPIIYISGCICGVLILVTLTAFGAKAPAIQMAKELKHSLPNVWISSLILLYLYLLGIFETEKEIMCRCIGMLLHLFIVASFMWILVGVHIIYCKVSKRNSEQNEDGNFLRGGGGGQPFASSHNKISKTDDRPLQRPLTRYYLFAYGVPTLIVAVTAAISTDHYDTKNMCFLNTTSLGPFIGSMVVPCVLVTTVMIGFGLSALCVIAASPSKVKETNEMKQPILVDKDTSPKSVLLAHGIQFLLLTLSYFTVGFQFNQALALNFATNLVLFVIASVFFVCYGAYLLCNYVIFREDITGTRCIEPKKTRRKSDVGSITVDDMTSNLVELCPRPLPPPISNTLDRQINYPSSSSYGVPSRIKDVNLVRNATDDTAYQASNVFMAPPPSEMNYPNTYTSLFGQSSKVNNLNIHPGMAEKQPKTSSPANSQVPHVQDLTVSPLLASSEPYSVVPVQYNSKIPEMSLASVNTGLDYTESSTIRMGAPCDIATPFDLGPATSASLIGVGTPKRLLHMGTNSSLPRSLRSNYHRFRKPPNLVPNEEDAKSKFSAISVGSSKSGHSKASGRKRHKRPNRRRSRQQINEKSKENNKEPLYNNIMIHGDEDYMGDDDHFESLERRNMPLPQELPSIINEVDDDLEEMVDDDDDDAANEGLFEDLPECSPTLPNDLPKRETSV